MSASDHFIGIDWGSTNARALLFTADGTVLEERDEPLGIKHVPVGGHRAAFDRLTQHWRERHGALPAFLSGMIGSRHGWREAPYLPCPASLAELHCALVPAPDVENTRIVPGLSLNGPHCDVMRGEELQVLGLGAAATKFDCICIPGTHAKWIRAEWPVVREFRTAMTGELFAAIAEHTLLASLIPATPAGSPPSPAATAGAFEAGIERSAAPHGLLAALFEIRAEVLLGKTAAGEIAELISGLLIGTEIRGMLAHFGAHSRVALLAAPSLELRYLRALRHLGLDAVAFDVKRTTAQGFVALRNQIL